MGIFLCFVCSCIIIALLRINYSLGKQHEWIQSEFQELRHFQLKTIKTLNKDIEDLGENYQELDQKSLAHSEKLDEIRNSQEKIFKMYEDIVEENRLTTEKIERQNDENAEKFRNNLKLAFSPYKVRNE